MKDQVETMANAVVHRSRSLSGFIHKTKADSHPYCPFNNGKHADEHDDYPTVDSPNSPTAVCSLFDSDHPHPHDIQSDLKVQFPLPGSLRQWKSASSETSHVEFNDSACCDDDAGDDLTTSSEASSIACFAQLFPKAQDSIPSFVPHFAPLLDDLTKSNHPDWKEDVPLRRLPLSKSSKKVKKPSTKKPSIETKKVKDSADKTQVSQSPPSSSKKPERQQGRYRSKSSLAKARAAAAADWYPFLDGVGSQFTNLAFAPLKVIQNLEETAVAHRVMTKLQQRERGTETLHPKALLKFFLSSPAPASPKRIILGKKSLYGPAGTLDELDISNVSLTTTASCSIQTDNMDDNDEDEFVMLRCDGNHTNSSCS